MENDESKTGGQPAPNKRKWTRIISIVIVFLFLCVSTCLLFLRSNTGMQKIVLPWLSTRINGRVTAQTAVVHFDGTLKATNLRIKTFDKNGNVSIFAKLPSAEIDLLKKTPVLVAPELDLEVIRWPQSQVNPAVSPASQLHKGSPLGNSFALDVNRVNVAVPPIAFMEGRSPRFSFSRCQLSCEDGMYSVDTNGSISFSECPPAWRSLDQTTFGLKATTSMTPQGLLWTGDLILSNRFSTAPLPDLEAVTLKNSFRLLNSGVGTMEISLNGKELRIADLQATIHDRGRGRSVVVVLSGPALDIPTHISGTRMKLQPWKSLFSVDWQAGETPFMSKGRVSIPGVSFSLPGTPATYLPPLALSGRWEASTVDKGLPSWYATANLLKGDKPLLKLVSDSSGSTPLEIKIPRCKLEELNLYAEPLGYALPGGELSGVLNISFDENQLYSGKLNLSIKDLEVGRGKKPEHLTASIVVEGDLRPQESLMIDRAQIKGRLRSNQGIERGNFTIELLKGSPIFFDPRDRLDSPGKLVLGLNATLLDQHKSKGDELRLKCRTGLNLTESPRIWFELLGNLRERTFIQGNINANLNPDWSLRYLEVSNANVQQLSGSHSELFQNLLGIELNSLSANTVIRENTKPGLPRYGFSGSLRYSGLRGLPGLPSHLNASQDIKVTGNVDFENRKLDIAEIKLQTQLSADDLTEKRISVDIHSKDPLQLIWSPRLVVEYGNLDATAVIPAAYLPNTGGTGTTEDLSLSARLTATTQEDGRHLMAIAFSSKLAKTPILSFNVFSNFLEDGQLESLNLNQLKLSIPQRLAASVGHDCPSVGLAQCNGQFKDNRFSLSASASEIGNISQLPHNFTAQAELATEGSFLGQHLTLDKVSLKCDGGGKENDSRFAASMRLKEQGRIRLNSAWDPSYIAVPLELSGGILPGLVNQLPLFSTPVSKQLKAKAEINLNGDSRSYATEVVCNVKLGEKSLVELETAVKQNRRLKFESMDLAKCVIVNQNLSSGILPFDSDISWKKVSVQGRIAREGRDYLFDVITSGSEVNSPKTRLDIPFNFNLATSGKWKPSSRVLQLDTVELDGRSDSGGKNESASIQLSSRTPLRLTLAGNIPTLTDDSSSHIFAKGNVSPFWLAKATAQPIPSSNEQFAWQSSIQVTPAKSGNRAVFSVNSVNKEAQRVEINGDLTLNSQGIPRKGSVNGSIGWNPAMELLSRRLQFGRWKQVDLQFAVASATEQESLLELRWKLSGIQSLLGLDKSEILGADGHLKSAVSMDGTSIALTDFKNEVSSNDGKSKLTVAMSQRWPIVPNVEKTAFKLTGDIQEKLILQVTNQPTSADDHLIQLTGDLQLHPKPGHFIISCIGGLKRNVEAIADVNSILTLTPELRLKRLDINRLSVRDSKALDQLVPALSGFAITDTELKGSFVKQGSGYDLSGALAIKSGRHSSWKNVSAEKGMVTFAAHSKDGKQFKLTNFDYNGELISIDKKEQLATLALELAEPGQLWLSDKTKILQSKMQCSAVFSQIPGAQVSMPESALTTTLQLDLSKTGITLGGEVLLNDRSGDVFQLQAQLESNLRFRLQRLKIDKSQIAFRKWISNLVENPTERWSNAMLTLDWSRTANTGELKGPYTFSLSGIESVVLNRKVSSRLSMNGVASMKMGNRPVLTNTTLAWHGMDPAKKKMFALNFRQIGDAFQLPTELAALSPGPVAVKGALYPDALIGSGNTDTTNAIPLNVDGTINIGTRKYRGDVVLKHNDDKFLDVLVEYDTKDKFGGLTLKSLPIPQALVDASPNPYLLPEYESAELKVTMRPGKEGSWMIYTSGLINQFRDRQGRTRTGNAKLESHCEFTEDENGQWVASVFPIELRWNDDVAFKCLANASTDLSSRFSLRFSDGSTPLPILFNVTHPSTLSPGLTCSDGALQTTGNFTIKEGTWVANSRLLIKDAAFEPMANFKRRATSFDWDFMINSKGILGISSDIKLTSKGPGWSNDATLDITWDSQAAKISFLKMKSDGANFTPFWEIFRRNRAYPSDTKTRPFNIYDMLPPDIVLRSMVCKYKLDLKKVECGPLQIEKMNVHLNASEGRLAIVNCEFELNNAPIWATGYLETTELGSNLEFKLNASKVPLQPIMSVIYDGVPADDVRGELTFEADIKSKGSSLTDAVSSATGNGRLIIDGFRFYKDEELAETARKASIDDLEYLEFETISSDLRFNDGKMIASNVKMERDELVQTMKITFDAGGKIVVSDIEHRITLSHYDKYFAGKVSGFFGFGPSSKGSPGYKVFAVPANMVRDASGWGVEVLDDNLFKPFKDSTFGKWFVPAKRAEDKK